MTTDFNIYYIKHIDLNYLRINNAFIWSINEFLIILTKSRKGRDLNEGKKYHIE